MIAIDPGNNAGIALFVGGRLARVELVLNSIPSRWRWTGPKGLPVVCEVPQTYRGCRKASLYKLQRTAEYLIRATAPSSVRRIYPREWKGQRPKEVDNAWSMRLLNDQERQILDDSQIPSVLLHNVMDAVGIGLWALQRRR